MSTTKLSYEGIVNLKFNVNGKVTEYISHNEGLEPLFKLYARALAGDDVRGNAPTMIDLRQKNGNTYDSVLNIRGIGTGCYYGKDTDGKWCTKITATLSSANLVAVPVESGEYRFYLMSNEEDLAFLPVEDAPLQRIQAGTQALIEWTLKVTNVGE
jgi:hypothetical protein